MVEGENMRQDYETINYWQEWKLHVGQEFCERNDIDITYDNLGSFTRFIMRRRSTGKYTLHTVPNYLLGSLLPSNLFNTMLHEIIDLEKQT